MNLARVCNVVVVTIGFIALLLGRTIMFFTTIDKTDASLIIVSELRSVDETNAIESERAAILSDLAFSMIFAHFDQKEINTYNQKFDSGTLAEYYQLKIAKQKKELLNNAADIVTHIVTG